jgi:uncharacterized protein Veg
MKRKFLASYQSITFDSFSKHTNFHTLIVNLDDIENEKQIPLKVFNRIQSHEKEKYSYSDFLPEVMLINFWEIEP